MNLRNYEITVAEVLKNPQARALLQKEFPQVMNHPMFAMAQGMPLREVINRAKNFVPKVKMNQLIAQLKKM